MKIPVNLTLYLATVVLICTILSREGTCFKWVDVNDQEFRNFLAKTINKYTPWLKTNHLDPSPATENNMKSGLFDYQNITFDCKISNHLVVGHSELQGSSMTESNFANHNFEMGRLSDGLREFRGDFECTGEVVAATYPELGENVLFSGQGKFVVASNFSIEYIIVENVGISQDYKLNLSISSPFYGTVPGKALIELNGEWNDIRISGKYFDDIQQAFGVLYINQAYYYKQGTFFPSGKLFDRYIREVVETVNLTEIIKNGILPEPFDPTRKPTTTTIPPPPSGGERVTIQAVVLILLQARMLVNF